MIPESIAKMIFLEDSRLTKLRKNTVNELKIVILRECLITQNLHQYTIESLSTLIFTDAKIAPDGSTNISSDSTRYTSTSQ